MTAFHLNVDPQGVGRLLFDLPDEKVNKFSTSVMLEFDSVLDDIAARNDIKTLVIHSHKKGIFVAGADIKELLVFASREEAEEKGRKGQEVFNKLAALPFPTIALIQGACLGGGCELALACDYRIASDDSKTVIGLPEVNLGIIPGWGGTQRLPRRIGLMQALPLILGGKPVPAAKAAKLGMVDALYAKEFFDDHAEKFIANCLAKGSKTALRASLKRNWITKLMENTPPGRKFIFYQSRKSVLSKTKGQYPAPLKALEVIEQTHGTSSLTEGLDIEVRAFSELAITPTCKNLIQVFFSNESLKKNPGGELVDDFKKDIDNVGVLGAGIMGGGIAWLFCNKDHSVRLKDIQWDAIAKGYQVAAGYFKQLLKIRKLKPKQVNVKMNKLSGTTDYSGFSKLDIVIEAIVENMDVKKKVLNEMEKELRSDAIICSNTSALSISEMGSVLERPENFVGMHFFNPVNRMPLVEIIAGEKTSAQTVAAVVHLTKKLGKTPVVVQDCSGFLVNRILVPYMNEAAHMLAEGAAVENVDRIILEFGMPMGPFHLADEVGIDVGYHVAKTLEESYGERMKVAGVLSEMVEDKTTLGKKTSKGFFIYDGKKKSYNTQVEKVIKRVKTNSSQASGHLDDDTILNRTILTMVNEAAKCLEEKVVHSPEALDMAMIMGTGFPPFRGGVLKYADHLGLGRVNDILKQLESQYGMRFKPAALIEEMAANQSSFYSSENAS